MTPVLSFFYGGLVGENSILTMMFQSYISMGVITILWVVVGFSLCFGEDVAGGFFGSPATYAMFDTVDHTPLPMASGIPGLVFAGYQGMFAVITPALMTGAFADRVRILPCKVSQHISPPCTHQSERNCMLLLAPSLLQTSSLSRSGFWSCTALSASGSGAVGSWASGALRTSLAASSSTPRQVSVPWRPFSLWVTARWS